MKNKLSKKSFQAEVTVTEGMKNIKLPVGGSDFKNWVDEGYIFVDKSLFIKEIIDSSKKAILMTCPRRFGKTANLSMLKYFFNPEVDKNGKTRTEVSDLFTQSNISTGGFFDVGRIIKELSFSGCERDFSIDIALDYYFLLQLYHLCLSLLNYNPMQYL